MKPRLLDAATLFSGIGGLDLGLERAGMTVLWQAETDNAKRAVLARHWPSTVRHRDVTELTAEDVHLVDVLCGGFPCQDLSSAGRRAGIEGQRSGLWAHYARLVGDLRPRYVLVENVPALLVRGLERVVGDLAALGYDAEWDCLPAAAFGAPQLRARIWLLAYPRGLRDEADDTVFAGRPLPQLRPRWAPEPCVGRVAHGLPGGMDRVQRLGDAVVPQVAEYIGRRIVEADALEHPPRSCLMPWVKMDDQRGMNRKLREAGFAARGLDEAAICQCSAERTDGFVSISMLKTLAQVHSERNVRRLVNRLVEVGRWIPEDGGWRIHGYLDYNPSAAQWKELAERKRAAGRQGGAAKALADATARATAPAMADATAGAMPDDTAGATADRIASVIAVPSRPVPYGLHPPPTNGCGGLSTGGGGGIFDQAIEVIATRQMAANRQPIGNRSGWLAATRNSLRAEHQATIAAIDLTAYASPEALADHLDPPAPKPVIVPNFASGSGALDNFGEHPDFSDALPAPEQHTRLALLRSSLPQTADGQT